MFSPRRDEYVMIFNQRFVLICALIVIICRPSLEQAPCPVEEDPVQLAECAQLDIQAIIQAARGNLKLFCNLAERYMECFKTKTRNCIGGWVRTANDDFRCELFVVVLFL